MFRIIAKENSDAGSELSFCKGDKFYVLSTFNIDSYFVSTNYRLPFSRNSKSGIVPIKYFVKDLIWRPK